MKNSADTTLAVIAQEKLVRAFALVRKRGVIARQNYLCCTGCASSAIAVEINDKVTKDARVKDKVKGVVFFHKQGGFFSGRSGSVSTCYLHFGQVETSAHGPVGLPSLAVAKILVECLREVGLAFEWDGTSDKCVEVLFTPPEPRRRSFVSFGRRPSRERVPPFQRAHRARARGAASAPRRHLAPPERGAPGRHP